MADSSIEHSKAVEQLAKLIHGIRVAMLTTVSEDGALRSRPMATQHTDFDGNLWFFTPASSPKMDQVEQDRHVNVSYVNHDKNHYVSVSGRGSIVRDRDKMQQLWSPILKAWFPKGLDDPDLALLKVHVEEAEYWDSPSSTFVKVAGFLKALATGKRYIPGDDVKVDFDKSGQPSASRINPGEVQKTATHLKDTTKKHGDPLGKASEGVE